MIAPRSPVRLRSYLLVYLLIAFLLLLAHGPLLRLPFYWDEIGQFIPAALDIYHSAAFIPYSTVPNVHPPAVMAYLALVWHLFGYSIAASRVAMLLLASLAVLFTFLLAIELARNAPGAPAFAAVAMLCVSPLFFAQSMLAQLDMPAMLLSTLALLLFLQDRIRDSAIICILLVLAKETGLISPLLFAGWLIREGRWRAARWYLLPPLALVVWLIALRAATGHWFGNAEFTRYNLFYPLNPVRLGLALFRRIYYLFIGSGHFIGTAALLWVLRRMPVFQLRAWRIAFAFVVLNVLLVSVLGGAVLERYLLPVLPIVYTAFAISFRALLPLPRYGALAAFMLCLLAANFINPLYPFPFENNLSFINFVELQKEAARAVDERPGIIATTFPMSAALRRPAYGYVQSPHHVLELKSFQSADIEKLAARHPDMVIACETTWDPLHLLTHPNSVRLMTKYFGFEAPLEPEQAARMLSLQVVRRWTYKGLKIVLLARAAS